MPSVQQGPGQCMPWQCTQEGTRPSLPAPLQEHPAPDQWAWVIKMEFCLPAQCDSSHRRGASATLVDVFPYLQQMPSWQGAELCILPPSQQCRGWGHPPAATAANSDVPHTFTSPYTHPKMWAGRKGGPVQTFDGVLGGGIILECHCNSAKAHFWQKFIGEMP